MNGCLFMTDKNMLEFVLFVDGVVNIEDGTTGISENVLYSFFGQTPDENVGACHF